MATHVLDLTDLLKPENGNVAWEPMAIVQTNDRYGLDWVKFADTATKDRACCRFRVPKNYVGAPKVVARWATAAITGNAVITADMKAIAVGASVDPSTDTETLTVTTAAPGTALNLAESIMSGTAGDFSADSEVFLAWGRNGAGSDTIAGAIYLLGLYFLYDDV